MMAYRTTESQLAVMGVAGEFVRVDVTRRADVDALVASSEAYGGVDVMVANAGITLDVDNAHVSEPDFERLMNVNLKGVLLSAQAAATQMTSRGKQGSIVLMGSMGGIAGSGMTVAYSASKGGVVMLAKALVRCCLGPTGSGSTPFVRHDRYPVVAGDARRRRRGRGIRGAHATAPGRSAV